MVVMTLRLEEGVVIAVTAKVGVLTVTDKRVRMGMTGHGDRREPKQIDSTRHAMRRIGECSREKRKLKPRNNDESEACHCDLRPAGGASN